MTAATELDTQIQTNKRTSYVKRISIFKAKSELLYESEKKRMKTFSPFEIVYVCVLFKLFVGQPFSLAYKIHLQLSAKLTEVLTILDRFTIVNKQYQQILCELLSCISLNFVPHCHSQTHCHSLSKIVKWPKKNRINA